MSALGLAETINLLRSKGYTEDYNLPNSPLAGNAAGDEFIVDQVFRFDVMTDPGDQSVLYAMHSLKTGAKGILVNGFGIYSEPAANMKLQALLRWENDGGKPSPESQEDLQKITSDRDKEICI